MKQYKITTKNILPSDGNDCVLSPDDPIHEIKKNNFLGQLDILEVNVYNVYPEQQNEEDRPLNPYGQH